MTYRFLATLLTSSPSLKLGIVETPGSTQLLGRSLSLLLDLPVELIGSPCTVLTVASDSELDRPFEYLFVKNCFRAFDGEY